MKIICRHRTCRCGRLTTLIVLLLAVFGCASGPTIVGSWQAVEGTASVTFAADGVFQAIDNEGMAVAGKYRLMGTDGIQFEVQHGGQENEVIDARVVRAGDQMTLIFPGDAVVESYQRIP